MECHKYSYSYSTTTSDRHGQARLTRSRSFFWLKKWAASGYSSSNCITLPHGMQAAPPANACAAARANLVSCHHQYVNTGSTSVNSVWHSSSLVLPQQAPHCSPEGPKLSDPCYSNSDSPALLFSTAALAPSVSLHCHSRERRQPQG